MIKQLTPHGSVHGLVLLWNESYLTSSSVVWSGFKPETLDTKSAASFHCWPRGSSNLGAKFSWSVSYLICFSCVFTFTLATCIEERVWHTFCRQGGPLGSKGGERACKTASDAMGRLLGRPRSQPPSCVLLCCSPMFSRGAIYPPHAMQYLNTSHGSDVTVQSATSQNLWSTQGKCCIPFVRHRHWENYHLLRNVKRQSPPLFLVRHSHMFNFTGLFVVDPPYSTSVL